MNYLTIDELKLRDEERLPTDDQGDLKVSRIEAALSDASEMVRTYLPSLIDEEGIPLPPPARIAGSLKPIVRDLCLYLLNDRPGEESAKIRYDNAINLLKALGTGESGSSSASGPEVLDSDAAELIEGTTEFIKPGGFSF